MKSPHPGREFDEFEEIWQEFLVFIKDHEQGKISWYELKLAFWNAIAASHK